MLQPLFQGKKDPEKDNNRRKDLKIMSYLSEDVEIRKRFFSLDMMNARRVVWRDGRKNAQKVENKKRRVGWGLNSRVEWTHCFSMGQNGLFLFIFVLFSHHKDKDSTNLTINDERVDGVLGSRKQGGRMEGAEKFTELWWHPNEPTVSLIYIGASQEPDVTNKF